jgi:hypothetical protein
MVFSNKRQICAMNERKTKRTKPKNVNAKPIVPALSCFSSRKEKDET